MTFLQAKAYFEYFDEKITLEGPEHTCTENRKGMTEWFKKTNETATTVGDRSQGVFCLLIWQHVAHRLTMLIISSISHHSFAATNTTRLQTESLPPHGRPSPIRRNKAEHGLAAGPATGALTFLTPDQNPDVLIANIKNSSPALNPNWRPFHFRQSKPS